MGISDELLKDSLMTEASMQADLEAISTYYQAMELKSQLIPALQEAPLPSLLAALPDDDEGRPRLITHSFLPLDEEDAEYTKFLQLYVELQDSLEGIDRVTLLEAVNRLNTTMPLGLCALVRDPNGEEKMVVRFVQGYPIDEPVDQGAFTETVLLFDLSCTLTSIVISGLSENKNLDEVFSAIGR